MPALALLIWPIIAVAIFKAQGRPKGIVWACLIAWLFLPEAYELDVPGLPPYDKNLATVIGLLLGLLVTRPLGAQPPPPEEARPLMRILITGLVALLILSPVLTMLGNPETIVYGPTVLPPIRIRELISMTSQSLVFVIPFLIAQRYLHRPEHHMMMLKAFVITGLGYSILVLFEVRMSPQLHNWLYGYFPTGWEMHRRDGSWRPIVFLTHGLFVGMFMMVCMSAAFILLRTQVVNSMARGIKVPATRLHYLLIGMWFFIVLVLSRNFGALLMALMLLPVLWFCNMRIQVWLAVAITCFTLIFPALRQTSIVTMERPVALIEQYFPERGQSLAFRIRNENKFLERIKEKPISGWGLWARWRVWDPTTGRSASTSDGRWASVLGERGWLGYIAYFGILSMPILLLPGSIRRQPMSRATTGIGLIMAATLFYQLPNNTIRPITLITVGALAGYVRYLSSSDEAAKPNFEQLSHARCGPSYTRFNPSGRRRGQIKS